MSAMGPLTKREHDAHERGSRDGYYLGFTCGQVNEWCFRRDRVRSGAFGAIRRAAEVARDADRCAEELWNEIDDPWEDSGAFEVWRFAAGCRAAIRAAIGSDKA